MLVGQAKDISEAAGIDIYPASIFRVEDMTFFYGHRGSDKFVGAIGSGDLDGQTSGEYEERPIILGPPNHVNAEALRRNVPWTKPTALGGGPIVSFGDRLGAACAGHLRAIQEVEAKIAPALALLRVDEVAAVGRLAHEVIDAATWGCFQEGYRKGFVAEADNLRCEVDITAAIRGQFNLFTINPCEHVWDLPPNASIEAVADAYSHIDFGALETSLEEWPEVYVGRPIRLPNDVEIVMDGRTFVRAAVRLGQAIAETLRLVRFLQDACPGNPDIGVSLAEMTEPLSPEEHYFFTAELRRLGVTIKAFSPALPGVSGDVVASVIAPEQFAEELAPHVAIMKRNGPYRLVLSPGADKFSLLPVLRDQTDGVCGVKVTGASYLEAMRVVAVVQPELLRDTIEFAKLRYASHRKDFSVSAETSDIPDLRKIPDDELYTVLDNAATRQVLHATVGSVFSGPGVHRFRQVLYDAINGEEELLYAFLKGRFSKYLTPLLN